MVEETEVPVENHQPAAAAVRNRLLYTILKRNTPNWWCKGFSALNLVGRGFKSQFKGQPKDYKIGALSGGVKRMCVCVVE